MNDNTAHLQQALKEIQDVCDKYGIYLLGTCEMENIYGEITIEFKGETSWRNPEKRSTEVDCYEGWYSVDRIGNVE